MTGLLVLPTVGCCARVGGTAGLHQQKSFWLKVAKVKILSQRALESSKVNIIFPECPRVKIVSPECPRVKIVSPECPRVKIISQSTPELKSFSKVKIIL